MRKGARKKRGVSCEASRERKKAVVQKGETPQGEGGRRPIQEGVVKEKDGQLLRAVKGGKKKNLLRLDAEGKKKEGDGRQLPPRKEKVLSKRDRRAREMREKTVSKGGKHERGRGGKKGNRLLVGEKVSWRKEPSQALTQGKRKKRCLSQETGEMGKISPHKQQRKEGGGKKKETSPNQKSDEKKKKGGLAVPFLLLREEKKKAGPLPKKKLRKKKKDKDTAPLLVKEKKKGKKKKGEPAGVDPVRESERKKKRKTSLN